MHKLFPASVFCFPHNKQTTTDKHKAIQSINLLAIKSIKCIDMPILDSVVSCENLSTRFFISIKYPKTKKTYITNVKGTGIRGNLGGDQKEELQHIVLAAYFM